MLDTLIGAPLILLLNVFARFLGFVLRIDHSLKKPVNTIVVCKFLGLGSIIQSTPLLQTLRKNYPGAKLIFVTSAGNRKLLQNLGIIDEVLTISDTSFFNLLKSSLQLVFNLWKRRPGIYIDLEIHSYYSNLVSTFSMARNRLGYFKKSKRYRKGVYTHLIRFDENAPISKTYLEFATLMGCKEIITDLSPLLDDTTLEAAFSDVQRITGLQPGQPYIVINPNASDLRLERRWPKESYAELIKSLAPSNTIVLIGDSKEQTYVKELESLLGNAQHVINSSGRLTLNQLIALISHCRLMITNDTGPMHIAFAMGKKTIALFGPCSPLQYGQVKNSITLYKQVHCSPCVHNHVTPPCHGNNICMKQIAVAEVQQAVAAASR